MTSAGLKALAGLTRLQSLNLPYTKATGVGLKELARLKHLHALDLSDAQVTDAGLKEIAALKSLRTLSIGGPDMSDAGVQALAELKQLQRLAVCRNYKANHVTEAGLRTLQKAAPLMEIQIVPTAWSTFGRTLPRTLGL